MPDLSQVLVFIHVASVVLFAAGHGTSMVIAFRLRGERDPARVAALLETSRAAVQSWPTLGGLAGFTLSGIWLGFIGSRWDEIWLWASIVILVIVFLGMTPLGTIRLRRVREALGMDAETGAPAAVDPAAAEQALAAWNPMPVALLGGIGLLVVLYLMMVKPF
jgi:hypothetical protein